MVGGRWCSVRCPQRISKFIVRWGLRKRSRAGSRTLQADNEAFERNKETRILADNN